jgi:integrase
MSPSLSANYAASCLRPVSSPGRPTAPITRASSGAAAGLSPHELRHSAASMAISAGASIKAVQKMLGHKSATLTLDRYGHLYPDELQGVADRLDSLHASAECAQNVPTRLQLMR